jgi:hypothetical protein
VVGGGLCGGFGAGRAGGVWGLLLGGEEGVIGCRRPQQVGATLLSSFTCPLPAMPTCHAKN